MHLENGDTHEFHFVHQITPFVCVCACVFHRIYQLALGFCFSLQHELFTDVFYTKTTKEKAHICTEFSFFKRVGHFYFLISILLMSFSHFFSLNLIFHRWLWFHWSVFIFLGNLRQIFDTISLKQTSISSNTSCS